MKYSVIAVISMLLLACMSCKRNVTCKGAKLQVSVSGFDSMDIIHAYVERYTTDGKPDGMEPLDSPFIVSRIDRNKPAAGYGAHLFTVRILTSYKIHVGKYSVHLTDIYFDGDEEQQEFGVAEVEPCNKTAHYSLNGVSFSQKPTDNNPVYIRITR